MYANIKEFVSKRLLIVNQISLSSQENAIHFSHDKLFLTITWKYFQYLSYTEISYSFINNISISQSQVNTYWNYVYHIFARKKNEKKTKFIRIFLSNKKRINRNNRYCQYLDQIKTHVHLSYISHIGCHCQNLFSHINIFRSRATSNLSQVKNFPIKNNFLQFDQLYWMWKFPVDSRIIEFLLRALSLSRDSRVCTYLTSSDLCIRSSGRSLRCSRKSTREKEKKKKRGVKTSWCYGRHDDGYRSHNPLYHASLSSSSSSSRFSTLSSSFSSIILPHSFFNIQYMDIYIRSIVSIINFTFSSFFNYVINE